MLKLAHTQYPSSDRGSRSSSVTSPWAEAPLLASPPPRPGLEPPGSKRKKVEGEQRETKRLPLPGLGLLTSHWSDPSHVASRQLQGRLGSKVSLLFPS